jgi:hypothetical protein
MDLVDRLTLDYKKHIGAFGHHQIVALYIYHALYWLRWFSLHPIWLHFWTLALIIIIDNTYMGLQFVSIFMYTVVSYGKKIFTSLFRIVVQDAFLTNGWSVNL